MIDLLVGVVDGSDPIDAEYTTRCTSYHTDSSARGCMNDSIQSACQIESHICSVGYVNLVRWQEN